MKRLSTVVWMSVLLALSATSIASSGKIALVLGGGGARGAAHIGIIEVLEQQRIPIDCVVGTSMGALVAGSYAAGLSPAQMRAKLDDADWEDMFLDLADYSELSYRKKKVSQRYLPGTQLSIGKSGLQLQSGVVSGEKIKLFFNQLVDANLGEKEIEHLSIPLAIVATDIGTGERVVFRSGSLTKAMRASMSVPGILAPLEYEGRKLVDGGLVDNLPIELGRELCGAEHVIAINVGSPLKSPDEIESMISVTSQMIGILTNQNVERSKSTLTTRDIYIEPDLRGVRATDFPEFDSTADKGAVAAYAQVEALRQFSVSDIAYTAWKQKVSDTKPASVAVDEVNVTPTRRVNHEYLKQQIRQQPGEPLKRVELEQDLIRIYGEGFYQTVDYQLLTKGNKNILDINIKEDPDSFNYVIFGFAIDNEYRVGSNFNARAALRSGWVNRLGGEFFGNIDVGGKPSATVDFYQPLDYQNRFFINPTFHRKRDDINLFDGSTRLAEYQLDTTYQQVVLGFNMESYGQAQLGWREYDFAGDADITSVALPDVDERYGGYLASLHFDRRNRLHFPSKGWRADASFFRPRDGSYSKIQVDLGKVYRYGDFIVGINGKYTGAGKDSLPFYDSAMMGGFLNLSGYATNQLLGDDMVYGHIRVESIIGRMPLGLNGDMRFGLGVEAARFGESYVGFEKDEWLDSGVIYLGGETPFGPIYLGYGFHSQGGHNLYFKLGAQ